MSVVLTNLRDPTWSRGQAMSPFAPSYVRSDGLTARCRDRDAVRASGANYRGERYATAEALAASLPAAERVLERFAERGGLLDRLSARPSEKFGGGPDVLRQCGFSLDSCSTRSPIFR